jgi:hypothetical protein
MGLKAKEPVSPLCWRFTPTSQNHPAFQLIRPPRIESLAMRYDRAESAGFLDQDPVQL